MTVSELRKRLSDIEAVHGDCDIRTTSTDGGEFFADVRDIATDVPADYGAGFPVVLLVLTTDAEQDSATDEEPEPEPQARQYDVDDAPECPECQRGRGSSLGFLGGVLWFRCRQCGMEYNMQGV
jgi:hypothetical protein